VIVGSDGDNVICNNAVVMSAQTRHSVAAMLLAEKPMKSPLTASGGCNDGKGGIISGGCGCETGIT